MPLSGSLAEARFWVDEETEEYDDPRGTLSFSFVVTTL